MNKERETIYKIRSILIVTLTEKGKEKGEGEIIIVGIRNSIWSATNPIFFHVQPLFSVFCVIPGLFMFLTKFEPKVD